MGCSPQSTHFASRNWKVCFANISELRGPPVSLRLGHARALTRPRRVIHSPRAASLPAGEGRLMVAFHNNNYVFCFYSLFIQLNEILNSLPVLACCPFFESIARKLGTFSAILMAATCTAIIEVATSVPNAFAHRCDFATAGTFFLNKKVASFAFYSANRIIHMCLFFTYVPSHRRDYVVAEGGEISA